MIDLNDYHDHCRILLQLCKHDKPVNFLRIFLKKIGEIEIIATGCPKHAFFSVADYMKFHSTNVIRKGKLMEILQVDYLKSKRNLIVGIDYL